MVLVCLPFDALFTTPTILLGFLLCWMRGSSSRPPPLTSGMGRLLSAAAPLLLQPGTLATPDLGRGVAPPGHASVRSVAAGALPYSSIKSTVIATIDCLEMTEDYVL